MRGQKDLRTKKTEINKIINTHVGINTICLTHPEGLHVYRP